MGKKHGLSFIRGDFDLVHSLSICVLLKLGVVTDRKVGQLLAVNVLVNLENAEVVAEVLEVHEEETIVVDHVVNLSPESISPEL